MHPMIRSTPTYAWTPGSEGMQRPTEDRHQTHRTRQATGRRSEQAEQAGRDKEQEFLAVESSASWADLTG